jgi:hypothetical protein
MRVLLVESTPGHAVEVEKWLRDEGHSVSHCFDVPVAFACRGADDRADCPLDRPADVAVLVRDLDGHGRTLTEMGAVCSMKHRIPVVEITEPHRGQLDTTLRSALAAADDGGTVGYERAALAGLVDAPGLGRHEVLGVVVTRDDGHVRADVRVATHVDQARIPTLVDRVARALRRHDPYASVIDVGVSRLNG